MAKAKTVRIQEEEMPNGVLPYPYFVNQKGMIGRQDYWKGQPLKVVGFNKRPVAGRIDLAFDIFWKNPEQAVGMYLVLASKGGEWATRTIRVGEVEAK